MTGPRRRLVRHRTTLALAVIAALAALPAPAQYTTWNDAPGNPVFDPGSRAGYPSVIHDADAFGVPGGPLYRMWYDNGGSAIFLTSSADGLSWAAPTPCTGLATPAHPQVLYDPDSFGVPGGPRYQIWFWDASATTLYSVQAIRHAVSTDGVAWSGDQPITQDAETPILTGVWPDWNRGSYGPAWLSYQPGASNSGNDPWAWSYVMYFDATTGGQEVVGLGFSADGLQWTRYPSAGPVLELGGATDWDSAFASFGTVLREGNDVHFFYSGGQAGTNEGIGHALGTTAAGTSFVKWAGNPIFHAGPAAPAYRQGRAYTPSVLRGHDGVLRMYYSCSPSGGSGLRVCLATSPAADLAVSWLAPTWVVAGDTFDHVVTIGNTGPDTAALPSWELSLPAGTAFSALLTGPGPSWSCSSLPAPGTWGTVACSAPGLDPAATAEIVVEVTVPSETPAGTELTSTISVASLTVDPDAGDNADTRTTLVCVTPTPVPEAGPLPPGRVGSPYDQTLTASGGVAPYSLEVSAGALPTGLSLGPDTGLLSGTPTMSGTVPFTVTATYLTWCTGSAAYSVEVAPAVEPVGNRVDDDDLAGRDSNLNGVLDPGETVAMSPEWHSLAAGPVAVTGEASAFDGPPGPAYTLTDASASYGTVAPDATVDAFGTGGDAYLLHVGDPPSRPAAHWDAEVTEILSDGSTRPFAIHIGESFDDVGTGYLFYRLVETILHNGVTLGCTATTYCPGGSTSRAQMAMFIARAMAGSDAAVPASGTLPGLGGYDCAQGGHSLFADVAPTAQYCRHVHHILAAGVTLGCTATEYCPTAPVSRGQMAMFIARAVAGSDAAVPLVYQDPGTSRLYSCDGPNAALHFADVPALAQYCRHAHYLWTRAIIDGCTGSLYCPAPPVTRGQMSKFLANAFALRLYE